VKIPGDFVTYPASHQIVRSQDAGWLRHLPGFASCCAGRLGWAILPTRSSHATNCHEKFMVSRNLLLN